MELCRQPVAACLNLNLNLNLDPLQVFMELCRQPVSAYLERFGFRSDLLKAMYAVTDGVSGLTATWDMPGSGLNFLCHNMVPPWCEGLGVRAVNAC